MKSTKSTDDESWRHGFVFAGQQAGDKASRIIASGSESLAVILDWDGVVTEKENDGLSGTSWSILKRHMSPENQLRHSQLFTYFRPLEKSGQLTPEGAEFWQRQSMELLIGQPIKPIEADARKHTAIRPGMHQLFLACRSLDIPIFINSAGEVHVIRSIAEHYGLTPAHIFSNEFTVEDGIITGVHEHTVTHNLNKHTHSHRTKDGHEMRHTTVVVGDNLHDAKMVNGDDGDNSLRIRLDESRDQMVHDYGKDGWQQYLTDSFAAGYDAVCPVADASSIVGFVQAIAKGA